MFIFKLCICTCVVGVCAGVHGGQRSWILSRCLRRGSVCCRRAELPRDSTILGKKELAHFNYAPEVARVSVGATA